MEQMENSDVYHLISGSSYKGSWDLAHRHMTGFGRYRYPNGVTYEGYFARGVYHGRGKVTVPKYNCVIDGFFLFGKVVEIFEIKFEDDLWVTPKIKDNHLEQLSAWKYCIPEDRRFSYEHALHLPAVGPESRLTASGYVLPLKDDNYDVGEGIFNMRTNLIAKKESPFSPIRYANCEERTWIKENCRCGGIPDISPVVQNDILANNLKNDSTPNAYVPQCNHRLENISLQHLPIFPLKSVLERVKSTEEPSDTTMEDYTTSTLGESEFDDSPLLADPLQ